VPTPLLATTLAELALLAAETPDADTLEQLAAGESIGTVVFDPDYVLNGADADVVIGVEAGALSRWTEFSAEPVKAMDLTRRLARVRATNTEPLATDPGLADTAVLLLAAEQVGAATRCLELTVEYTKERVQFGRPIGSFQALKHRMADLYVKVQTAGAVVDEAVQNPSPTTAALAHITASEAFRDVAAEAVQMHGGIAITWEGDIQLYFKRAHGSSQLFGHPADYLRHLEAEAFATG
jgi:Acyl-CoA dehydrogenase, C-terminal domain